MASKILSAFACFALADSFLTTVLAAGFSDLSLSDLSALTGSYFGYFGSDFEMVFLDLKSASMSCFMVSFFAIY